MPFRQGTPMRVALPLLLLSLLLAVVVVGHASAQSPGAVPDALAQVAVGDKIAAENACYVRLPDMPGARYAGFGAYNPETGVLAFAGGAQKIAKDNTRVYNDLFAIKLDGSMDRWNVVPYSAQLGYTRQHGLGCLGQSSVQLAPDLWASVAGKAGCDGDGNTGPGGGDIKMLKIGAEANATGVRFVPSGVAYSGVPSALKRTRFSLALGFAAHDTQRDRVVFGQGALNYELDSQTYDEVYSAQLRGGKWQVQELRATGPVPRQRFSTCAAYVYDKDTGVDGVFVLGGQQGGPDGAVKTSYKEVWWLDFSDGPAGHWQDITARFANMDDFGFRRGGACAYNTDTKTFYSWMGRSDPSVPDGTARSAGAWSVDLSALADDSAPLTWQRLAKDLQTDVMGRRLFPSVYDPVQGRFFAMGGLIGLTSLADVWAIYPGVTGQACTDLDPYAPFAKPPVPRPTPRPTADPSQPPVPEACDYLTTAPGLPPAVISQAIANPGSIAGYLELANPNKPAGPWNQPRRMLGLQNPSAKWHPLYNSLIYKAGCP